jgi:hypothetical protein
MCKICWIFVACAPARLRGIYIIVINKMSVKLNKYALLFPVAWVPQNTSCYLLWKKNSNKYWWQWQIIEKYFCHEANVTKKT